MKMQDDETPAPVAPVPRAEPVHREPPRPRNDGMRDVLVEARGYLEGLRLQKYFVQRHYKLDALIEKIKNVL